MLLRRYEPALYLAVFALLGSVNFLMQSGDPLAFSVLLFMVPIFGSLIFAGLNKVVKRKLFFGDTVITLLIMFLVLQPAAGGNEIILFGIAVISAILAKFFLGFGPAPIFNPAAFGMIVASFAGKLFPVNDFFVGWWGMTFFDFTIFGYSVQLSLVLILGWIIFELRKYRRIFLVISFLTAAFIALTVIENNTKSTMFLFSDATIYFLAAVMLTDPKTSPISQWGQISYGVLVALLFVLFKGSSGVLADNFFLLSLLAGNLCYLIGKRSWNIRSKLFG